MHLTQTVGLMICGGAQITAPRLQRLACVFFY
jgi:hypothetical protein